MENVEGQACEEQQNIFNCSDENYFNMSIITISPENDNIQDSDNNGVSGGHYDSNVGYLFAYYPI